ncbi:hypothetical protein RA276_31185, partial [Pseudomonas syringae pv. tagetis]
VNAQQPKGLILDQVAAELVQHGRNRLATGLAVAALLDEFGVTLIEDEPYREVSFDGGSAQPIDSRLKTASCIYTGTDSK